MVKSVYTIISVLSRKRVKDLDRHSAFELLGLKERDGALTAEQIGAVKGLGCLRDKRYEDIFNVRVITRNGKITTDEARAIAEAADLFGSGEVAMTSRMTQEIQGVSYDNIPSLILFLRERGLDSGGTGPKVRPVVSCKGTTCTFGLIDTFGLSLKIHERFYKGYHGVKLPHKFKIAVGGCPNNCVKPDLNDVGIIGQRVPTVKTELCRACKACAVEKACPIGAARLENGKIALSDSCNSCGRCMGKCPFGAFGDYKDGYRLYIGGRWGKKIGRGTPLSHLFTSEEEILSAVEKCILLFKDKGIAGERFADTVARIGFERAEAAILGDEILARKEEIINK